MSNNFYAYDADTGKGYAEHELADRFDEVLDECCGEVSVAGMTFDASRALKELDPIAYRCAYLDWLDGEESLTESDPAEDPGWIQDRLGELDDDETESLCEHFGIEFDNGVRYVVEDICHSDDCGELGRFIVDLLNN